MADFINAIESFSCADAAVSKLTLNYWRIEFLSETTENEIDELSLRHTGCVIMLSAADDCAQ